MTARLFFNSFWLQEVDPLVESEILEDWDIFTCINCGVRTHALHVVKRYSRVLVSKELKVCKLTFYV
mgnify:CR=1 FL=1